jgi:ABC-2 type transport system ATP-binding protein
MALQVSNLTKVFGEQRAVDNISFEARQGQILGFLGPNGAGKSTTMKILTSYIPPTEGSIRVGGFDVIDQAMEVKKITGYLPEHNPLYLDMYVHEYLHFIGKLYGLKGLELKNRLSEMVELCGLEREQNKRIETLSKGYRQRVGLAQALIHNPSILILDEPTSGLDPNQLLEIRKLIKDISVNKTVIFSTHIMQEVEALCERVIVINRGKLVADELLSDLLKRRQQSVAYIIELQNQYSIDELKAISNVQDVVQLTPKTFRLVPFNNQDIRADIFQFAADKKLSLVGLREEENSLESIFHQLTRQ